MSDQDRQLNNPWEKPRGGNRSGNSAKRKSSTYEQRNEQGRGRQSFSPQNNEASGVLPPGFVNKPKKHEKDNNSERHNRHSPDQGEPYHQKGNQRKGRSFKMDKSINDGTESDQTLTSKDETNQRITNTIHSHRSTVKVEPDVSDSEKSLDHSLLSKQHVVKTEPAMVQSPADPNKSRGKFEERENQVKGRISSGKSCVTEIERDLFTAPADVSLVHCVGADLRMGSGVAVRFRDQFKSIGKLFDQQAGPGHVAFISHHRRYVFYLITKQSSTGKPTEDTMRKCLLALRDKCKEFDITKLAMPRIGCGLDGLSWNNVKLMLEEIFANGFSITVYQLDKGFVDKPERGSKSQVKNKNLFLKHIEKQTGLLYIGCAEPFISEEMKSLNEEYPFLRNLKQISHKLGTVVRTPIPRFDEVAYGLICKRDANSCLSYEHLENAIQQLREQHGRDRYQFFGLQAFVEKRDPHMMDKIETLFRNSGINAEFWICWPPSLTHMRPSNSNQNAESMEVHENSKYSDDGQQSSYFHSANSAKQFTELENKQCSVEVQGSGCEAVREVEVKMNAQSLAHEAKSGASMNDSNYSQPTNDTLNNSNMDWFDQIESPEIPEQVDSSHNIELSTEEWSLDDSGAHIEDERRKSREKRESIRLNKQKEKQESTNVRQKSCVKECKGDLFDAPDTMCLAHCVGADFRMGSGIAVLFRQKFGSVSELLSQRIEQGGVAFIQHENRHIFYLVTKRESTGKPTYRTLEKSLLALREKCKQLNITELAMPRIGCGLDRLEWSEVRSMLEDIFADGFSLQIYNLEKDYKETKQSQPKTTIKHEALFLKDIPEGTGLLYIGTVEPFLSEEMKSLDEKYRFIARLDKNKPKLGTVVRTEASYPREIVYGLICRQSANDPVDFIHLHAALKQLRGLIDKKDHYSFLGIQAFEQKHHDNIMGKLETMFRYSYIKTDVWMCYPPTLLHLKPLSLSAFSEPDFRRLAATVRDVQRTIDSMDWKLNDLEDIKKKVSSFDNDWKEACSQITSTMNDLGTEMRKISSKTDNLVQESHENLPARVKKLEETVEFLVQQIVPYNPVGLSRGYHINGAGHPRSRFSNGPPSLLHDMPVRQICPPPFPYYERTQHSPSPSFSIYQPVYATDYVPEEKEALLRATKEATLKNGYADIWEENGVICVRKNKHSAIQKICNYEDLSLLN